MSSTSEKKVNLVTLLGPDGSPLSFDRTLAVLAGLLMNTPIQPLVQALAEISGILYEQPSEEAEKNLRSQFCSKESIACLCPENDIENIHLLFHPSSICILNSLLTFDIKIQPSEQFDICIFNFKNGVHRSITLPQALSMQLPILEVFLLANQLVIYLEGAIENISLYYAKRRVQEDAYTAISKSKNLYDNAYFNTQLLQSLGYTVPQLASYQFLLFIATKMHKNRARFFI
jgi:hypothetical protein